MVLSELSLLRFVCWRLTSSWAGISSYMVSLSFLHGKESVIVVQAGTEVRSRASAD